MRFKKTRDVLAHVSHFHREISAACDRVSNETDAKRLKLLLDYVSEREKQLADAVSVFTQETSAQVLDTWFQYTSDDMPIQRLLDSEMKPDMIITMGCKEKCPNVPGAEIHDWDLPDPSGQSFEFMCEVLDKIEEKVKETFFV